MYIPVDDPRIQRALSEGQNLPPGTDPVNGYVNFDYKGTVWHLKVVLRLLWMHLMEMFGTSIHSWL